MIPMETTETPFFQPTLLGTWVAFQDEGLGMITDENECEVFIESRFFTGWMSKAEFYESIGVED
jgi:hypothetical protein